MHAAAFRSGRRVSKRLRLALPRLNRWPGHPLPPITHLPAGWTLEPWLGSVVGGCCARLRARVATASEGVGGGVGNETRAGTCCRLELLPRNRFAMAAKDMQVPAGVGRRLAGDPRGRGHVRLVVTPRRAGVRPQGPRRASSYAVGIAGHETAASGGRAAGVWPRTWGRASGRVCRARRCYQAACKCLMGEVRGEAARLTSTKVRRAS